MADESVISDTATPRSKSRRSLLTAALAVVWWLLRHPFQSVFLIVLVAWATLMTSLQFSPQAQEHFNKSLAYFGVATASQYLSEAMSAADSTLKMLRQKNAALEADVKTSRTAAATARSQLAASEKRAVAAESKLRSTESRLARKERDLVNARRSLITLQNQVLAREKVIADNKLKFKNFKKKAAAITRKHNVRMMKAVSKTASGEVIAWVPVIGDAASVGFSIAGTVEMCRMFQDLEIAAAEYGVPLQIYTGTFCEDPKQVTMDLASESYADFTAGMKAFLVRQRDKGADAIENYWPEWLKR